MFSIKSIEWSVNNLLNDQFKINKMVSILNRLFSIILKIINNLIKFGHSKIRKWSVNNEIKQDFNMFFGTLGDLDIEYIQF
jgi:hypothetical protein